MSDLGHAQSLEAQINTIYADPKRQRSTRQRRRICARSAINCAPT